MPTLQEELDKEFTGKTVTITPSADNKEWTIKVDNVEETVPAGKDSTPKVATLPSAEGTKPYFPSDKFSQVKGTDLSTGLVITDEVDDDGNSTGNEYVWIEVPRTASTYGSSFNLNYDFDSMIEEQKNTAYTEIATALRNYCKKDAKGADLITVTDGTETTKNYKSTTVGYTDTWYDGCGIDSSANYEKLYNTMLQSVYKNGGFWIGRYEAGNGTARNNGDSASGITPLSKVDLYPINWVTCSDAQTIAGNVPNKGTYNSSLMFGIQWDLVLRHLSNKGVATDTLTGNSESWGNYDLEYDLNQSTVHGYKGSFIPFQGDMTITWTTIGSNYSHPKMFYQGVMNESVVGYTALSTGATTRNIQKNIYDLAGNLYEFTLEKSYRTGYPSSPRGGRCDSTSTSNTVSFRYDWCTSDASDSATRISCLYLLRSCQMCIERNIIYTFSFFITIYADRM